MGGTCSTTGKDENCLKNLDRENWKEEPFCVCLSVCFVVFRLNRVRQSRETAALDDVNNEDIYFWQPCSYN
jgi:hypothetical protein